MDFVVACPPLLEKLLLREEEGDLGHDRQRTRGVVAGCRRSQPLIVGTQGNRTASSKTSTTWKCTGHQDETLEI